MKKSKYLILLFLLYVNFFIYGQETISEFVIITYEISKNKNQHSVKDYYWIIPTDSIANKDLKKFPLYFDEFSKDDLKNCKEGKDILLFTLVSNENFNIDNKIESNIKKLKIIIKNNRKKIMQIIKKWSNGYKEKVTIFATPVKGSFCYGKLSKSDEKAINYKGIVYLPIGNFSSNNCFFGTDKYTEIKYKDYISTNYVNSW